MPLALYVILGTVLVLVAVACALLALGWWPFNRHQ